MHESSNPVLNAALRRHLQKWYPSSSESVSTEAHKGETDNGGAPVAPISFEATKIDINKIFQLEAVSSLKEQIKELKEHES